MTKTTDALGHALTPAHWRELPAAVTADGQVSVLARLFVPGRSGMDAELAVYFPQPDDEVEFLSSRPVGEVLHFAATGALTQYVRAVICDTRDGRYMLPLALVGQWHAGAQSTVYYAHMIEQRRLQRFPVQWLWEAEQFAGRGRMTDPARLTVSRSSPPSPLLES